MKRKMCAVILWYCTVMLPVCAADITKAYSFYLLKEYDSALVYYQRAYEQDTLAIDPYYGLINCYTAMQDYRKALNIGTQALTLHKDVFLYQKLGYVYGLMNKVSEAQRMYDSALVLISSSNEQNNSGETIHAELINSLGYGFYYKGNYRIARKWFEKGKTLFPHITIFDYPLSLVEKAEKNLFKTEINLSGGIKTYSNTILYNNGYPYSYKQSGFYDATVGILYRLLHQWTFKYSHTNVTFKDVYGHKIYTDTLDDGTKPPEGALYDSIIYPLHTEYYIYIIEKNCTKDNPQAFATWQYPVQNLWEDAFYGVYRNYGSLIKNTTLSLGIRYTHSNMLYTNDAVTVFGIHRSSLKRMTLGNGYFFTDLPDHRIVQLSPECGIGLKPFSFGTTLHFLKVFEKSSSVSGIPEDLQISADIGIYFHTPKIQISTVTSVGKRAFLCEADGALLHNITSPHTVSQKVILEVTPFKVPLTMYALFKISRYSEHTSLTNAGGLYYQW